MLKLCIFIVIVKLVTLLHRPQWFLLTKGSIRTIVPPESHHAVFALFFGGRRLICVFCN